jgi:hypothetical protein
VAVATTGVYLAFDGGPDASGPDGPEIGPYDEIVLRGARAVGEREGLGRIIALRGSTGRWRDAETESSSAVSEQVEVGGADLHFSARRDDVLVRFLDDAVAGHESVPDLGPYALVVVGTYEVRGDEETLAVRVSRISPWQLTDRAGAAFQGTMKDALVFVATVHTAASPARPTPRAATDKARPSRPEVPSKPEAPAKPESPKPGSPPPADDAAPGVWVDRVKAAPNIYISRPDRKR